MVVSQNVDCFLRLLTLLYASPGGGEVLPYMGYIGMYMTHPGSANDLSEVDVHPVVTAYKMSIVRLTIFQFHQLGKKRKHL